MAGMAAVAPLAHGPVGQVRVLRPLLMVAPARLRATLRAAGLDWVEDPTNTDLRLLRARLRHLRQDPDGDGQATRALVASAHARGEARAAAERAAAVALAARARLYPEGYAVIDGSALPPDALGSLIGAIGGARPPSASATLSALAAAPRPCTLAGVRLMPAGRLGPGSFALLLVREGRAMAGPVAAVPGAVWDGRFVLGLGVAPQAGATFGPLGAVDAARLRRRPGLPISVLAASPAVRLGATLLAAPAVGLPDHTLPIAFAPCRPAGSVFDV
jgi:tRNA(Ile)-lysidine synthase